MLSKEEVVSKYKKLGVVRGNEFYLRLPIAYKFVADCQENELAILGMEGFIYDNDKLAPQMEMIADYSSLRVSNWKDYKDSCNKSALGFLQKLPSNDKLVINFVILSCEEKKNNEKPNE